MKKANLFKSELIEEIQVKCPVTGKEYVCDLNDPDLFCPACGEPHEPRDYMVYYKDGSECSTKTCHVGHIPETPYVPSELIHSEEESDMDVEVEDQVEIEEIKQDIPVVPKCQSDEDFCDLDL